MTGARAGGQGGSGPGGGGGTAALLTPPRVRALLAEHRLVPRRSLGQNYLADPNTARKVARLGGARPGLVVLEIGAGLGSLTLALREAGARVVAVELDAHLVPVLEEVLGGDEGVRVERADALDADLAALAPDATTLIANLPYRVAVTIVLRVLERFGRFTELTVMVQREVGERLVAQVGTAAYGAVSVKVAALAETRIAAAISRRVFIPEPHVDSVLVQATRRPHPAVPPGSYGHFALVVAAAFAQRRKTLRNSLRTLGMDPAAAEAACLAARVDPGTRAERLDVPSFARLAAAVAGPAGHLPLQPG